MEREGLMDKNLLIDIVGWIGVAGVLIAYALVSTKRIKVDSAWYQALNVLGAGLLMVNSFYYGAYPSVGVNIVWVGIAIYALARRKSS